MATINRHSGQNLGGIHRVSRVFVEEVAGFSQPPSSLYCLVSLKSGCQWSAIYGTPETILIESDQQDTSAGLKYIYKVKMLVPKDRVGVETELLRMAARKLILKVEDKNGTVRILGNLQSPMMLTSRLLKPPSPESFNGYELIFSGEFSAPAAYLMPSSGIPEGEELD